MQYKIQFDVPLDALLSQTHQEGFLIYQRSKYIPALGFDISRIVGFKEVPCEHGGRREVMEVQVFDQQDWMNFKRKLAQLVTNSTNGFALWNNISQLLKETENIGNPILKENSKSDEIKSN